MYATRMLSCRSRRHKPKQGATGSQMRLSEYTDYTLRVLMYCANRGSELVTIAEMAEHLQLSKNHLMKIVNELGRQGVLETVRGRGGGIRLGKPAAQIRVGDMVRVSETDFRLVECFDPKTDECTLTPGCRLKSTLKGALKAYMAELDKVTLADLTSPVRPRTTVSVPVPRSATSSR